MFDTPLNPLSRGDFYSLINFSPMTGMFSFSKYKRTAEQIKTTIANTKSNPPSSLTSIPKTVKWLTIAPLITPSESRAPNQLNLGISKKIAANNSVIPEAYLPNGSKPTVSKMYMLSGAPVNLKNSVCNKIPAAVILSTQNRIFNFEFIVPQFS
jgi:hypothetical protein